MTIREIASGLKFPEGPIAMDDGSVIVVEIQKGTLTRVKPDGKLQTLAKLGGGPNGAAIGPDGAVYVCNNGGFEWSKVAGFLIPGHIAKNYSGGRIERVDLRTGKTDVLYTECDGVPLRGPNDLVFDKTGGFWFTDHAKSTHEYREWGALYYAQPDGSKIVKAIGIILSANGVGLSPDEGTVYYAETLSGRLMKAEIEKPGKLKPSLGLTPGTLVANGVGHSYFDSLAVQADGGVCVATLLNSGISTIYPNGKIKLTPIPGDPMLTNICFGGKNLKTAYITLSGTGKLIAMDWPKPGLPLNFLNK
jgi:gluconolactonase